MKIAVSTGIAKTAGGLFYAVSSLCKALQNAGEDISVFGDGTFFSEEDRCNWGNLPINAYNTFGPLQTSLKLRHMLRVENADLVHQHGIWMDDQWAVLQWQRRSDRPVVVSPHGMLDPWALKNSAWKKRIVEKMFSKASLKQATCIHALCSSEANSIRDYGLNNPIAIIPNGVELPDLAPQKTTRECDKKRLLFLGRIHPKKGLKELIQAWAKAQSLKPKDLSEWQLIIAGWDDGDHEAGLIALSSDLGVGDSVEFVGSKFGREKDILLCSVDAFVLPSYSEGLPMSVLEAWSYRLPVLMTGFCNLPEGFDVGAAIRIEPNTDSIQQGLEMLTTISATELQSIGLRGRTLVEEKFTWRKIAEDMRRVYKWCVLGGEVPSCMVLK